ncbi:hypothetical protein CTI12_AA032980 [Artemisia annua]|uniref:Uncharacterized protein n=1 Tax=Artemisia annua TaxID=35608 RepID=A0A2U1QGC6_ARTAN|nr:hypothetical protein CTI12_AA032980 [Artemisia annua]
MVRLDRGFGSGLLMVVVIESRNSKNVEQVQIFKEGSRYNMVFVSFTVIDNDGKSVTIVAGMLKSEHQIIHLASGVIYDNILQATYIIGNISRCDEENVE